MDDKQDFTEGSIFKKMIHFMFPILGALILQAMYGAVDMLIVGRFGTAAAPSAVSTGSNIMNLLTFVLCALASGVTILIGRYLGEKNNHKIGPLLGRSIAFFLAFAVLFTVLLVVFAEPAARLMKAPEEAMDLTVQYIRICGGGFIFVMLYNLISCIFRGMGNSKLPLLFVGIACVVNIFGDLLLVAVFKMDVAGAAIATVVAQAVSVILSLLIIKKQTLPFTLKKEDIRFGKEIGDFLKIGTPIALQEFLTNLTFLALCAFINNLGLDASNGYGIAQKIQSFVMLIPSAIFQCMASFVAQNVGAGKIDRLGKGLKACILLGAAYSVIALVVYIFFAPKLSLLFLDASEVEIIANAKMCLIANGMFYFALALVNIVRFMIQGMGFSSLAVFAGVFEMIARGIVGFVFVPIFGYRAACFASPAAWVMADIFLIPAYIYCVNKLKKQIGTEKV